MNVSDETPHEVQAAEAPRTDGAPEYDVTGHLPSPRLAVLPLSQAEFERSWLAKDRLIEALQIEERFVMLVANYQDMEKAVLGIAVDTMVQHDHSYDTTMDRLYLIARHLQNFLSTARLYRDQCSHAISIIYGNPSEQRSTFESLFNAAYDGTLAYRAMEGIRNIAQHQILPVRTLHVGWKHVDRPGGAVGVRTVEATLSLPDLRQAGLKPAIIEELEELSTDLRLMPLVRQYLAAIARVHRGLRELMTEDLSAWEAEMMAPAALLRAAHPEVRWIMVRAHVGPRAGQTSDLFEKPMRRLERLRELYIGIERLDAQVISSLSTLF